MSGENYVGQEESLRKVITNIKSALLFADQEIYYLEATIKSVTAELEKAIQTLNNLSTQNDTHACSCNEKTCKDATFTYGEKESEENQDSQDLAPIVTEFLKALGYDGPFTVSKHSLIIK